MIIDLIIGGHPKNRSKVTFRGHQTISAMHISKVETSQYLNLNVLDSSRTKFNENLVFEPYFRIY